MTAQTNHLLEAALKLPVNEREELADRLYDSLSELSDEEWEAEFKQEIARRIKDCDEGREKPIPWEVLKADLEKIVHGESS